MVIDLITIQVKLIQIYKCMRAKYNNLNIHKNIIFYTHILFQLLSKYN